MKILLVLNHPNREIPIMDAIAREILTIMPEAQIQIKEMCTPSFNSFVLNYKPDVILTFPFTCVGFSTWYYIFKSLFKTKIISFRAEGLIDINSESNIQAHTGFDTYGKNLVDYEVFWGCKMAEIVGKNLLRQDKLSSMERVRSVGYPRLEIYFSNIGDKIIAKLPNRIMNKINGYARENIVFFVTGFQYANYTIADLFNAKDLDTENRLDELIEGVEITRRFRQAWVENIIRIANEYPQLLLIVKKHPLEQRNVYNLFEDINNILYIYEDIEIHDIMRFISLFFHYGSTSVVDSYLVGVPSIYVYPEYDNNFYTDLGWPSSARVPVSHMPQVVNKYLSNQIKFTMTPQIIQLLKEIFNIEEGKTYNPSREIAHIILDNEPSQKIPFTDIYLWKSLSVVFGELSIQIIGRLVRLVKKVLRMDPDVPLLRRKH